MGKKREEKRRESLDVLARIANKAGGPPIKPKPEREPASRQGSQPAPGGGSPPARPPPRASDLEGAAAARAEREAWKRRREMELRRAQGIDLPPPPPTPEEAVRRDRDREARARLESRRAREESLRELSERRKNELFRAQNLGEARGPWMRPLDMDPKAGRQIRRTPPRLDEKIGNVLGGDASSREQWAQRQNEKRERAGRRRRK